MQEKYEKFSSYFKNEARQETTHKIVFVKEGKFSLAVAFRHTNADHIELCVYTEDGRRIIIKSKTFPRLGFERRLLHVNAQLSQLAQPVPYQDIIDIVSNDFFTNI